MRVREAIAEATAQLTAAHVASAGPEAQLLLAHVLGVARGRLILIDELTVEQVERFRQLTAERAGRVPLQHLVGSAPFRQLAVAVGPGVFVPRPETEQLVGWGLHWLTDHPTSAVVVDLCSGSGVIAASVVSEGADVVAYAVEASPTALSWLGANVAPFGVRVVAADATDPATLAELDGRVDLVLTNPPYVPEVARAGLAPEVTDHDPPEAVFGGPDGLDVIRPLITRIGRLLRPGGAVGMEHDETHASAVPALFRADGRFTDIELHHDLARRPRFTTATRV